MVAASSSIAEPEPIAPVVRTRGRRRKSTRKTLPLDPLRVQAAEVLMRRVGVQNPFPIWSGNVYLKESKTFEIGVL